MAWIESHQELGRHPKTKKLARLLGEKLPTVVGRLHYLWWWALDFAQDGDLSRYTAEDIADAALWNDEEAEKLLDALIECGYIERTESGMRLHDWDEYAGKLIERREKDRQRKREAAASARRSAAVPSESDGNETDASGKPSVHNQPTLQDQPDMTNSTRPHTTNTTNRAAAGAADESFAQFWAAYPKKVGRAKCQKIWEKLKPSAELVARILEALEKQKKSIQWTKEGGTYIPNPQTWLNRQGWDDELPAQDGGGGGTKPAVTGFHVAD